MIFILKRGGDVAKRLTDRQKKKIVADYLELQSYNATAKENGVSKDTVKRVVRRVRPKGATKKGAKHGRYAGIYGFQKRSSAGGYR